MRRFLMLLGAVAVVAALASTAALAYGNKTFDTPNMPNVKLKDVYDRSTILNEKDGLVQLPRPVGNERPYVSKSGFSPYVTTSADNLDVTGVLAQSARR